MDINKINEILTPIALAHPGKFNQELALRNISVALMHLAQGIREISETQASHILQAQHPEKGFGERLWCRVYTIDKLKQTFGANVE